MIQKTILFIVLFSLLAGSVAAAVQMKVVTPAFVVSDVPFLIGVQFHTGGQAIGSAQAAVKAANSPDTLAQFTGASQCSGCLDNNLLEIYSGTDNGKPARILKSNGKVSVTYTTSAFTQNFYTITAESILGTGQNTRSEKIELVLGPTNTYMKDADGNSLAFEATTPVVYESAYEVRRPECGNGVVDYFDTDVDNSFDDTEQQEACDDGNKAGSSSANGYSSGKDGCSSDCKVVDLGYTCSGTALGDRNSACTTIKRAPFFLAKMDALFTGQCYPNNQHPGRVYTEFCDDKRTLDNLTTGELISKIADALLIYLTTPTGS